MTEPIEIRNLFNPAFLASILAISINSYQSKSKLAFPYFLSFLIIPLILHKKTRDSIPGRANAKLHKWINENPQIQLELANRIKGLNNKIKKGILVGIQGKLFNLTSDGRLNSLRKISPKIWNPNSEVIGICKKAHILGSLFSTMDAMEIYAILGVKP
ncbi:MAG: three component ABC system middle component [Candidatus Woesearchaeota archaeon]